MKNFLIILSAFSISIAAAQNSTFISQCQALANPGYSSSKCNYINSQTSDASHCCLVTTIYGVSTNYSCYGISNSTYSLLTQTWVNTQFNLTGTQTKFNQILFDCSSGFYKFSIIAIFILHLILFA